MKVVAFTVLIYDIFSTLPEYVVRVYTHCDRFTDLEAARQDSPCVIVYITDRV